MAAAGRATASTAGRAAARAGDGLGHAGCRSRSGITCRKDSLSLIIALGAIGRLTGLTEWTHLFKLIFTTITNVFVNWHKTPLCS